MMIGFPIGERVLVRLKHESFNARVCGWWEDAYGRGPSVMTDGGRVLDIDTRRIVKSADTDEILFEEA